MGIAYLAASFFGENRPKEQPKYQVQVSNRINSSMLAILSIIIGIVFVLLLFSMLTSAVVEVYHAAFSSRGKHLRETIEIMLGKDICEKFYQHPYFRQLSSATKPRSSLKLPVWVDRSTFSTVLADVLTPADSNLSIPERIRQIENPDLRRVLDFLWRQADGNVAVFQEKVERWFDDVMARAKGWFADATRWRLFFFGLVLAGVLNADTIQIYKSLSANAALRDELVQKAALFASERSSVPIGPDTTKSFDAAKQGFQDIRQTYIDTVQSPLGLGWGASGAMPADFWAWIVKLVGWALTGVAVTMGAPFWYDMLKKLLAIKSNAPNSPPPPSDDSTDSGRKTSAFETKAVSSK